MKHWEYRKVNQYDQNECAVWLCFPCLEDVQRNPEEAVIRDLCPRLVWEFLWDGMAAAVLWWASRLGSLPRKIIYALWLGCWYFGVVEGKSGTWQWSRIACKAYTLNATYQSVLLRLWCLQILAEYSCSHYFWDSTKAGKLDGCSCMVAWTTNCKCSELLIEILYIYIHTPTHTHMRIYIYIYIYI